MKINSLIVFLIQLVVSTSFASSSEALPVWADLNQCNVRRDTIENGTTQGQNAKNLAQKICEGKRNQFVDETSCLVECTGLFSKKTCQWQLTGLYKAHKIGFAFSSEDLKEIDLGSVLTPTYFNNVKTKYAQLRDNSVIINSTGRENAKVLSADLKQISLFPKLIESEYGLTASEEIFPVKNGFFWVVDRRHSVLPYYKTEVQVYFSEKVSDSPNLIATYSVNTNSEIDIKKSSNQSILALQTCDYDKESSDCFVRLLNKEHQLFEHSYHSKIDFYNYSSTQISIGKNQTVWKFDQNNIGIFSANNKIEIDYPNKLSKGFLPLVIENENEDLHFFYDNNNYQSCTKPIYVLNSEAKLVKSYSINFEADKDNVCRVSQLNASFDSTGRPIVVSAESSEMEPSKAKSYLFFYQNENIVKKVEVNGFTRGQALIKKNGMVAQVFTSGRTYFQGQDAEPNTKIMIFDLKGNLYFSSGYLLPEPTSVNDYLFKISNLLSLDDDKSDNTSINFGFVYGSYYSGHGGADGAKLGLRGLSLFRQCEDYFPEKKN